MAQEQQSRPPPSPSWQAVGSTTVAVHCTAGRWHRVAAPAGLGTLAAIPGTTSVWGSATAGIAEYSP